MIRMPFAIAIVFASLSAGSGRADTLPLFSDVPAQYIPGTTFTFQITVPDFLNDGSQLNGLSKFQVGLVFDASVNNPPLTVSAAPPGSGYVFPGSTNFSSGSFPGPGPNEVSLQFSDSIAPNFIAAMPGQDILATVTVNPDISLTGPIDVSFTSDTLITYFNEGFDQTPGTIEIDQGSPPPPSVPTPASWLSLAIGVVILAGRNRLK